MNFNFTLTPIIQVLLNPLEEQLHLPALLVNTGNGLGRPVKMIGSKDIMLARFCITKTDPPHWPQVILTGTEGCNNWGQSKIKSERFKQEIEALTGRRFHSNKRGRPVDWRK